MVCPCYGTFEARNPSNPAIVCEIDGVVAFGAIKRGNREIIVEAKDGVVRKYLVPLSRQILVQDGDFVKAGAALSDGQIAPADIFLSKDHLPFRNTWSMRSRKFTVCRV